MIQVFKTDEDYKKWLDGQRLPSGIVVYVSDDETMYFSTNNIKGELKTYECKKDEVIDPSEPTEPTSAFSVFGKIRRVNYYRKRTVYDIGAGREY